MMTSIAYGEGFYELEVPRDAVIMEPVSGKVLTDARSSFFNSLNAPIGARPIREIISPADRVVIVTSDNTRPLPNDRLVPWLLEALHHVPLENITVLIGTGSHRACTNDEIRVMFGDDISRTLRIINHDAFDRSSLGLAGFTDKGEEILLNREYLEADKRITLGFIEPHFFAGFSGGPKAVLPGIAGIDTILRFHSADMIRDPRTNWGVLDGNPVYGMASRAACLVKPDFSINLTMNPSHDITGFFCGDVLEAHRAGAGFVKAESMCACDGDFDIVITSNSGHPLDRNFYQAVKGICAAGEIVRDGGTIICLSHCGDGIPGNSDFHEILKMRETPAALSVMLDEPSFARMEAWQAHKLVSILTRAEVHLHSSLSPGDAAETHCVPCPDPAAVLARLMEKYPNARTAVLRFGPITIPYINGRGEKR